jgi:hypothetical protein
MSAGYRQGINLAIHLSRIQPRVYPRTNATATSIHAEHEHRMAATAYREVRSKAFDVWRQDTCAQRAT